MPTLVRELYLLALLLSLLGFLLPLVQCEPKEPHHWRQLMERRQPHLKIMNPHDHFAHIMGGVHVLMEAGKQYSCEHNGLDVFGSPLMYKAHLNPRFHIFNSDFDNKIQDVYIEDDPLASLHKRGWSLSGTISSVTSFVKKAVAPAINF